MNKLLSKYWWLLVGGAVLFVLGSALASYFTCDWLWFSRSGSILTMVGVILSIRPLLRMGFAEWLRSQKIIDCGSFETTQEELEEDRQTTLDAMASCMGSWMIVAGTIIWAYGDLIGSLLSRS